MLRKRHGVDSCLLPNTELHRVSCGLMGCHILRFSPSGKYLAAACGELLAFTVKVMCTFTAVPSIFVQKEKKKKEGILHCNCCVKQIYDVETGRPMYTFSGHEDLIYDLAWSTDGRRLASASSDW